MPRILSLGCLLLAASGGAAAAAGSSCMVVGDSVGVGVGMALKGTCSSTARVGLGSSAVADRVTGGAHWSIVSLGSNDFPRGIAPAQRVQSEARVRAALATVAARAGGRLILILPANGARGIVEGWARAHGVQTVGFAAGRDGIHPRNYAALAQDLRGRLAPEAGFRAGTPTALAATRSAAAE